MHHSTCATSCPATTLHKEIGLTTQFYYHHIATGSLAHDSRTHDARTSRSHSSQQLQRMQLQHRLAVSVSHGHLDSPRCRVHTTRAQVCCNRATHPHTATEITQTQQPIAFTCLACICVSVTALAYPRLWSPPLRNRYRPTYIWGVPCRQSPSNAHPDSRRSTQIGLTARSATRNCSVHTVCAILVPSPLYCMLIVCSAIHCICSTYCWLRRRRSRARRCPLSRIKCHIYTHIIYNHTPVVSADEACTPFAHPFCPPLHYQSCSGAGFKYRNTYLRRTTPILR